MGQDQSVQGSIEIQNPHAAEIFQGILTHSRALDLSKSKLHDFKKMLKLVHADFQSMNKDSVSVHLSITGKSCGPLFCQLPLSFLHSYAALTHLNFRSTSLTSHNLATISQFLKANKYIVEVDLSENSFSSAAISSFLKDCQHHPTLSCILLSKCGASHDIVPSICTVVLPKTRISKLDFSPIDLSSDDIAKLSQAFKKCGWIQTFKTGEATSEPRLAEYLNRNILIDSIIKDMAYSHFQRSFRTRNASLKSIRERKKSEYSKKNEDVQNVKDLFLESMEFSTRKPPKSDHKKIGKFNIGTAETINTRTSMDDVTFIEEFGQGILIGVLDGHGGRDASEYVALHFSEVLRKHIDKEFDEALKYTFEEIHETIITQCVYCGTCANICYLQDKIMAVSNCGDSQTILIRKGNVTRLTPTHRPNVESEREYIENNGGFVENNKLNGLLGVSRAIGNGCIGNALRATPDVQMVPIDSHCRIVIACDGVFDFMSDQDVAKIALSSETPLAAAEAIRTAAIREASDDNISVAVIFVEKK